jgi:hypothetical protein
MYEFDMTFPCEMGFPRSGKSISILKSMRPLPHLKVMALIPSSAAELEWIKVMGLNMRSK